MLLRGGNNKAMREERKNQKTTTTPLVCFHMLPHMAFHNRHISKCKSSNLLLFVSFICQIVNLHDKKKDSHAWKPVINRQTHTHMCSPVRAAVKTHTQSSYRFQSHYEPSSSSRCETASNASPMEAQKLRLGGGERMM